MRLVIARFFILLFILSIAPQLAHATDKLEYPEDIAARLQSRYDNIRSLSFQFHQDVKGEMSGRPRQGDGHAIFFKHDAESRMRWDYTKPDMQVLVSDGKTFSMYFSELHQMIVSPASNLDSDLTYSFFTGQGNLKTDFFIRPPDEDTNTGTDSETKIIKLIPKTPQSQVQDIHVWVSKDSLIKRLKIRDHVGTITILDFNDIKVNIFQGQSLDYIKELFTFAPPQGTEIIHQ
jgi:outer membrane lipoprotein carrier protein